MSEKHFHACPLCYRHAPCRMDCFIEPDRSADRPTGHTTPCDECSKPPPVATADLAAALRGYAGDGSIEPVDAPASLLLRAADALDVVREYLAAEDAYAAAMRAFEPTTDLAAWTRGIGVARDRCQLARAALEALTTGDAR